MTERPPLLTADALGAFGDLFGGRGGGDLRPDPRSRDLRFPLAVTLAEASDGGHHRLQIPRFFACPRCRGRGAPAHAATFACLPCEGRGSIERTQGLFVTRTTCAACRGFGERREPACSACEGRGGQPRSEPLDVRIPGGVTQGHELRFGGKGNDLGDGEGPGDLIFRVSIGHDARLRREGDDLHTTVVLAEALARDGGVARVQVLDAQVEVTVPGGTTSGATARLVGYGALKLGSPPVPRPTGKEAPYRSIEPSGHRGDLVVTFGLEGEAPSLASHYAALGLAPGACLEEIRQAYRYVAMMEHLDRNPADPDAARRFGAASAAYAALCRVTPPDQDEEPRGGPMVTLLSLLMIAAGLAWVTIPG